MFDVFSQHFTAYGATLIEHSLIEVGLPGSVKVDSQVDAAQGIVAQFDLILLLFSYLLWNRFENIEWFSVNM